MSRLLRVLTLIRYYSIIENQVSLECRILHALFLSY